MSGGTEIAMIALAYEDTVQRIADGKSQCWKVCEWTITLALVSVAFEFSTVSVNAPALFAVPIAVGLAGTLFLTMTYKDLAEHRKVLDRLRGSAGGVLAAIYEKSTRGPRAEAVKEQLRLPQLAILWLFALGSSGVMAWHDFGGAN